MSDYEHVPTYDGKIEDLSIKTSTFQALGALVHWLQGFEAGGHGRVPGHFELVMLLRTLKIDNPQKVKEE